MKSSNLPVKQIVNVLFLGLITVFIFWYVRDFDFDQIRGESIRPGYIVAASLVALAFRYWGVFIWQTILLDLGATKLPGFAGLSKVYAKAWLGRYIPGKVTWIAGKVYFASEHGISKRKLAVSSILEALTQIIAIFALSLIFLAFDDRFAEVDGNIRLAMLVIGGAMSLSIIPSVFNWLVRIMMKVLRRKGAEDVSISGRTVTKAFALYMVGYFISGLSYFFFTKAFFPVEASDTLFVIATFNIAGAIGIASIVTPSGLGVREGVQLLLLPAIMPKEMALVITAASRLWSVAIDVLFFFVSNFRKNR